MLLCWVHKCSLGLYNLVECSLYHYVVSFLSLTIALVLDFILSDITTATVAFFSFPLEWNIFFHPFTFILWVSFDVILVSWRQHTYGSCFLNHSVSYVFWLQHLSHLYLRWLLINMHLFATSFLNVFLLFLLFLLLLLFFFSFWQVFDSCCTTGLVLTNSFSLFFSGVFLGFLSHFWCFSGAVGWGDHVGV